MTDAVLLSPWERIRAHWGLRTLLCTFHVAAGVPISVVAAGVLVGLGALTVAFSWTVVVPLVSVSLLFWLVPKFTSWQRARFAALLGVEIDRVPRPAPLRNPFKRLYRAVRTRSTWRQIVYHLLSPLIGLLGVALVIGAWSGALISLAVMVRAMGVVDVLQLGALSALSAVLLVVAPFMARAVASLDTMAAQALLGPSLSDLLAARVETLRESRAEVVDAADAERRRIERDLHDGTQQRLVSLAMKLGMARAAFEDLPPTAKDVIVQAHEEAKLALKELRDFVRGLHPAVLNDEGLDAALSGLAAGAPFPVRLRVELAGRVSPTIEAVAFFVVSEALTNIAKHALASSAEVTVHREGGALRLVVADDGVGGADPALGTGLRGLTQRVGSVDGILNIDSPPGGPTRIEVELPCE
ncbi:sensor histidine kinase [Sinosporangium siamense]|uniref:histidine kinase n=1 Tax=Sinosporangium siamense TaxID=1367973 RepID=A0A919RBJ9_9ACTN|nr:sensor histidine kinase [Sinosporangium siamense]GII90921.1 histidine kinase [Sinosporangium siamense]